MNGPEKDIEEVAHGNEQHLTLIVHSPRSPEARKFTWKKTTKVGDAAAEASAAFGYESGNYGLQTTGEDPRVLDNNKTLIAEHMQDGDELELVSTGGGV